MPKLKYKCLLCHADFGDEPNRSSAEAALAVHGADQHGGIALLETTETVRLDRGNVEYIARRSGKTVDEIEMLLMARPGQMLRFRVEEK
jgi:hypothetical protein